MNTRPLPPPIKPRALKRAKSGFGYETTDGRYEVTPAYAPSLRGGSVSRPSDWIVTDRTTSRSRSYPDLAMVRELYCAPGGKVPWLVCDMDDGVLRVEPTRAAAAEWRTYFDDGLFLVRADRARASGWDPEQQPLYPYPGDPFEQVDRPAPKTEETT
ncbi:hypothetical protein [Streptomyces sp. NPDC088752]|uniref:hypothetical protein n=1 Tax=Streptomyces sp. NPDC088752 TaxID=3154963 RepID=UPI0034376C10